MISCLYSCFYFITGLMKWNYAAGLFFANLFYHLLGASVEKLTVQAAEAVEVLEC